MRPVDRRSVAGPEALGRVGDAPDVGLGPPLVIAVQQRDRRKRRGARAYPAELVGSVRLGRQIVPAAELEQAHRTVVRRVPCTVAITGPFRERPHPRGLRGALLELQRSGKHGKLHHLQFQLQRQQLRVPLHRREAALATAQRLIEHELAVAQRVMVGHRLREILRHREPQCGSRPGIAELLGQGEQLTCPDRACAHAGLSVQSHVRCRVTCRCSCWLGVQSRSASARSSTASAGATFPCECRFWAIRTYSVRAWSA